MGACVCKKHDPECGCDRCVRESEAVYIKRHEELVGLGNMFFEAKARYDKLHSDEKTRVQFRITHNISQPRRFAPDFSFTPEINAVTSAAALGLEPTTLGKDDGKTSN